MASSVNLAQSYAQDMKFLGHGHGFYETESANRVQRGVCGYIDDIGRWRHIVDLKDEREIAEGGYDTPGTLTDDEPATAEWKGVASEGVERREFEVGVGVDAAVAAAAGAGSRFHFVLAAGRTSGAAIICNTPVYREGFENESILRNWAKRNVLNILRNCSEVKRYGFYVVQTTWASEDVWINAWTGAQRNVSIDFNVHAAGAGEVAPAFRYTSSRSVGQWIHPLPSHTNVPERRVLFFKGLQFKIRLVLVGKGWVQEMRGSDSDEEVFAVLDPDDNTMEYEVECFRIGEDGESVE